MKKALVAFAVAVAVLVYDVLSLVWACDSGGGGGW